MSRSLLFYSALVFACGSDPEPSNELEARTIAVATPSAVAPEPLQDQNTRLITRIEGGVVGIAPDGSMLLAAEGSRDFKPVPNASPHPEAIGISKTSQGYLAWSEHQVWIGTRSALQRHSLSEFFEKRSALWIDASLSTIWLTSSDGVYFARDGAISKVELSGGGAISFAIAEDADHGLLFASSGVYRSTIGSNALERIGASPGRVFDSDRASDGTLYVATERGLLLSKKGQRRLLTFPAPVRSITVNGTGALILSADQLIEVEESSADMWTATAVGRASVEASSVGADGDGNAWVSVPGPTGYFPIGRIVSFEADIKAIMVDKCMRCHADSARRGPFLAFDDYATAQAQAPRIVERIKSASAPMPPPSEGIPLSADQIRLVSKWALGGARP
jgi:hypothetical protein